MNEIRLKKTYADNRLKRFKTRNVENSLTKQTEIHKILNITFENSIDVAVRNIVENLNTDSQIFENKTTDNNLLNSKIRNTYARIKFSTRCSNRLMKSKIR